MFEFYQNANIRRGRKEYIMKTNLRNRIIAGVLVAVLAAGTVIATVAILVEMFK